MQCQLVAYLEFQYDTRVLEKTSYLISKCIEVIENIGMMDTPRISFLDRNISIKLKLLILY